MKKTIEFVKPVFADLSEENEYICETAGFMPLEVKFKRFEQAGMQLQFQRSEFTSSDYRQMYLNPDWEINPEDDLEDIQEKLELQQKFINEITLQKQKSKVGGFEETANPPSDSAAEDKEEEA